MNGIYKLKMHFLTMSADSKYLTVKVTGAGLRLFVCTHLAHKTFNKFLW